MNKDAQYEADRINEIRKNIADSKHCTEYKDNGAFPYLEKLYQDVKSGQCTLLESTRFNEDVDGNAVSHIGFEIIQKTSHK